MTHLAHPTHRARHDVTLWRAATLRQQRIATDRAIALAHRIYPVEATPALFPLSHYLGNLSDYLEVVAQRDAYRHKRSQLFTRAYVRLLNAQLRGGGK